eukprot:3807720-Prymnesium_polylepis.1
MEAGLSLRVAKANAKAGWRWLQHKVKAVSEMLAQCQKEPMACCRQTAPCVVAEHDIARVCLEVVQEDRLCESLERALHYDGVGMSAVRVHWRNTVWAWILLIPSVVLTFR